MPNLWQVVKPLSSINLTNVITNPSAELGTPPTGFTAIGAGTLSRDSVQQRRGVYACKYVPAAGTTDGFYYTTSALTTAHLYVASLDFYGASAIPYNILFQSTAGVDKGTPTAVTGTAYWTATRVTVAWTTDAGAAFRIVFRKNSSADVTGYWVDGLCLVDCTAAGITQAQAQAFTYWDGDQPGAYWTGTTNASTSVLSGQSREGGVLMNWDTDLNTFTMGESGLGMPPEANVIIPYGLADGGLYQRTRHGMRAMVIGTDFRGTQGVVNSTGLKRKPFFDAVKADLVTPQQQLWLRYTGALKPQWIRCVYDAGGERTFTTQDGLIEKGSLRFVAADPLFYEEGNAGTTAAVNQSITANSILQRSAAGVWSQMGTGASTAIGVYALALGLDGAVYAGGGFSQMSGVANTSGIATWNGSSWAAVGTGVTIGPQDVNALVVGPDGTLYAGGVFGGMGGVANTSEIAKWDGSAWSALGTGGNASVQAMGMGLDGTLYAGGQFTLMGGVASTVNIAKWNGSAWSAMGTGGNNNVYAITIGADGSVYAAGAFTQMGGVANTSGIAKWNGSAWVSIGNVTGTIYALATGPDGALYAGGNFSVIGGVTVVNIAKWNGSAWSAMGTGVTGGGFPIYLNGLNFSGNTLYMSGTMTVAGGLNLPGRYASWNGSTYIYVDFVPPTTNQAPVITDFNGNTIFGFSSNGSATVTINPTFTNNGTAIAHPIFVFTGPGTLQNVKNYTTGDTINFNITLNAGERATLNLTPGNLSFISSFRGNILGSILPSSQYWTFKLMPGANNVSVLITASTGATTWTATWKIANLSADGGAS